jgi:hypothetical protein
MENASERLGTPAYSLTRPLGSGRLAELQANIKLFHERGELKPPQSIPRNKLADLETIGDSLRRSGALTLPENRTPPPKAIQRSPQESATASPDAQPSRSALRASSPPGLPATHRLPPPAPSGYANAEDTDAVPLRDEGKERYRHYLSLPSPKAFAIYASGAWRFSAASPEAMTLILDHCARQGEACWLYAVDDRVVWDADVGRRVGRSAQLRGK